MGSLYKEKYKSNDILDSSLNLISYYESCCFLCSNLKLNFKVENDSIILSNKDKFINQFDDIKYLYFYLKGISDSKLI